MNTLWFNANSEREVIDFDTDVKSTSNPVLGPVRPIPEPPRRETPSPKQIRNRRKLQRYIQQYGTPQTPSAQKKLKTIVSVPLCCLWKWKCCKKATFING